MKVHIILKAQKCRKDAEDVNSVFANYDNAKKECDHLEREDYREEKRAYDKYFDNNIPNLSSAPIPPDKRKERNDDDVFDFSRKIFRVKTYELAD